MIITSAAQDFRFFKKVAAFLGKGKKNMDPVTIIVAVIGLVVAIAAYVFGSHSSDTKVLALKEKLDAMDSKPSKNIAKNVSSKSKSAPKAKEAKDNKKLNELKETVKKTKSQLHSAKAEIKTLKEEAKSKKKESKNPGAKQDADLIFKLREEVGELKSALETAKTSASKKKNEKQNTQVERVVDTEGMDDSSKAAIHELETAHRAKLKSLNEKHRKSEKEIQKKLRAASGNVDKQRRRADNNDRAYKITQRQVDALQERIAFLEKGPDDKPVQLQIAAVAAATVVEAKVPETKIVDKEVLRETVVTDSSSEAEEMVPSGLSKPSEPTTIEMSPDIADEIYNTSGDTPKVPVSVDSLVAAPDSSAVDDAWAEFDVE